MCKWPQQPVFTKTLQFFLFSTIFKDLGICQKQSMSIVYVESITL